MALAALTEDTDPKAWGPNIRVPLEVEPTYPSTTTQVGSGLTHVSHYE